MSSQDPLASDTYTASFDICKHCYMAKLQHGPLNKCLFMATNFEPVELNEKEYGQYRRMLIEGTPVKDALRACKGTRIQR